MIERRERLCFAGEPRQPIRVTGEGVGQDLQRDVAIELRDAHITWPERSHVRLIGGGDLLFGNGEGRGATFAYTVPLDAASATHVTEPTNLNLDAENRRTFVGGYLLAEIVPTPAVRISTWLRLNVIAERRGEGQSVTHARPSGRPWGRRFRRSAA